MKKIPTGIKIIGILFSILASLSLLGALSGVASILMAPEVIGTIMPRGYLTFSLVYGIVMMSLVLLCAINILRLKEWARKLFVYLIIFGVIFGFASLIVTHFLQITSFYISLIGWGVSAILYLIVLWYLTKPEIKKAFS